MTPDLIAAARQAAQRAFPRVDPYTDREQALRLAKLDACIVRARGSWIDWAELTDDEAKALVAVLEDVAAGRVEVVQRASHGWECRTVPVGRRRDAAKGTTGRRRVA